MATKVKLSKRETTLLNGLMIGSSPEVIKNLFSGDSCELDARGVALYDFIKGSEALRLSLWNKLQEGLTLFRKLYPSEYYTLLD